MSLKENLSTLHLEQKMQYQNELNQNIINERTNILDVGNQIAQLIIKWFERMNVSYESSCFINKFNLYIHPSEYTKLIIRTGSDEGGSYVEYQLHTKNESINSLIDIIYEKISSEGIDWYIQNKYPVDIEHQRKATINDLYDQLKCAIKKEKYKHINWVFVIDLRT